MIKAVVIERYCFLGSDVLFLEEIEGGTRIHFDTERTVPYEYIWVKDNKENIMKKLGWESY